jgi:hypothetical protein
MKRSLPWRLSPDARERLAKCLLVINSFAVAMYLAWFALLWLRLVRLEAVAGPVIVGLYFVSLFGFPISVICLRGIRRPKWVTVALVLNTPFYVLQLLALAFGLMAQLRYL